MVKRPVIEEDAPWTSAGNGSATRRRTDSGTRPTSALSAEESAGDGNRFAEGNGSSSRAASGNDHALPSDAVEDYTIADEVVKIEDDSATESADSGPSDSSSEASSCADDSFDDFPPYSPPPDPTRKAEPSLHDSSSDSDGAGGSDNEGSVEESDPLLFQGAPITLNESMLSVLTLALAHHLSGTCLDDILQLIALHCPEPNLCKKTFSTFKKHFAKGKSLLVRHYYCTACFGSLLDKDEVCSHCDERRGVAHFLGISVLSQLGSMYKRQGFRQQLMYRFNRNKESLHGYEDMYDGRIYKHLKLEGNILADANNISFTWHSDGVRLSKTNNSEMWPFYLTINELPYSERTKIENVILAGIWFGASKPVPQLFLKSIREDLLKLNKGVSFKVPDGEPVLVRGLVICGVCDLPAKAIFLNMTPHNSSYGCQKCKIRSVKENNRAVFKFQRYPHLRKHQETLIHAQKTLKLRRSVFGVKGPSALTFVYHPIETTAIDMHDAYLGISKILNKAHFSADYHKHPASLFGFLGLYDRRLASIRPPYYVQRLPRSFAEYGKFWEASELKVNLMIYSLPLFQDIMSVYHFEHHMLLVYGLYLLSKDTVSEKCVELATEILTDYCSRFEDLYGNSFLSCHVHQLIHLPSVVRDFGPLWVTSCAPYESLNSTLQKFVQGNHNEEAQVSSAASLFLNVSRLSAEKSNCARPFQVYIDDLSNRNKQKYEMHPISRNFCALGKLRKPEVLPDFVYVAIAPLKLSGHKFYLFDKVLHTRKNMLFSAESCDENSKRNSSCVKYQKNNGAFFGILKCFLRVTDCQCVDICHGCNPTFYAIIYRYHVQPAYRAEPGGFIPFIHRCADMNDYEAVRVECLTYVCFLIEIEDRHDAFIVEPINTCRVE